MATTLLHSTTLLVVTQGNCGNHGTQFDRGKHHSTAETDPWRTIGMNSQNFRGTADASERKHRISSAAVCGR